MVIVEFGYRHKLRCRKKKKTNKHKFVIVLRGWRGWDFVILFFFMPFPSFYNVISLLQKYTPFLWNSKLSHYINAANLLRHGGYYAVVPFIRLFSTIIFFSIKLHCPYTRCTDEINIERRTFCRQLSHLINVYLTN